MTGELSPHASQGAPQGYRAKRGPRRKLWVCIARVLRSVTSRKGSPAFLGTLPHSVTRMVTVITRGEPGPVRKGARGADSARIPVRGWLTRVTVTGGPASTASRTSRARRCGATGRTPGKVTVTVCAGKGSSGAGAGRGRVAGRVPPRAGAAQAVARISRVRMHRRRRVRGGGFACIGALAGLQRADAAPRRAPARGAGGAPRRPMRRRYGVVRRGATAGVVSPARRPRPRPRRAAGRSGGPCRRGGPARR